MGFLLLLGACDAPATIDSGTDTPTDTPSMADTPPVEGAPVITRVEWSTTPDCAAGVPTTYTVTTYATDTFTPPYALTYSGRLEGCSGTLDAGTDTVSCPNGAPYRGMVTVTDGEGNSDTHSFTVTPCIDGSSVP